MTETIRSTYSHTQRAPLHYILFAVVIFILVGALSTREEPWVSWLLIGMAGVFVVLGASFCRLTIRDEGDALGIRYGPLPLFWRRIPYPRITAVEPGRSSLIDGWGIHYIPGRGWTYNLWGYQCVKIKLGSKVVRVGSPDPQRLAEFLRTQVGRNSPDALANCSQ